MVNTTGDEEVGRFRRVPVVLGRSWPLLLIALMIVFLAGEELTPRVIRKATLEFRCAGSTSTSGAGT